MSVSSIQRRIEKMESKILFKGYHMIYVSVDSNSDMVKIDNFIQGEEQKALAEGKLPFVFELFVE